jgi:hypothetical protein
LPPPPQAKSDTELADFSSFIAFFFSDLMDSAAADDQARWGALFSLCFSNHRLN